MSLIPVATTRWESPETCTICGAGKLISFNWDYARTAEKEEHRRDLAVYVEGQPPRHGQLYACRSCQQPWYLYGEPAMLNFVPRERMELIWKWNSQEIILPPEQADVLRGIGATPPDLYGNGSQYCELPCAVTTKDGTLHETALISVQKHAPFEEWRTYQLAGDIAKIEPSRFALSRAVREATANAGEIRMSFAPTLVDLPDGRLAVINGVEHFFVEEGVKAADIRVSSKPLNMNRLPPMGGGAAKVVHFVADGPRF